MEKNLNINDMENMERAAKEFKEDKYKFEAFISYRHLEPDATIAQEIHKIIETFKVPKEFYNQGERPKFRVFRDREELTAKDLSDSIEDALKNSKYLIVICSKRTPLSKWCVKEIETFRKLHGDDRIIPVLIEGEPHESFPQPLKELKRGGSEKEETQDVLAVDLRPDEVKALDFIGYERLEIKDIQKQQVLKKESVKLLKTEKYRLMATILGVSYGDLKQRDKERLNRTRLIISSIVTVAMLIFGVFMTNAYQRAERARKDAVQSNASILLKSSREMLKDGDSIKSVMVAEEAIKSIEPSMENYLTLKSEALSIFNDSIYHSGAAMLTSIPTRNRLTYFSLSPDGQRLAFGYGNNNTAVYDPNNGQRIKMLEGHTEQIKIVNFSPDNKYLASASYDQNIIIYNAQSFEEEHRIEKNGIPMLTKFSDDGKKLLIGSLGPESINLGVYNSENWDIHAEMEIFEDVSSVSIRDDGNEALIISKGNIEGQLTRRELATGKVINSYSAPKFENTIEDNSVEFFKDIISARYSKDGKSIIVNASGDLIKMNIEDGKYLYHKEYSIDKEMPNPIETSDANKIVVKSGNSILIIDGSTGEKLEEVYFDGIKIIGFDYSELTNTIIVTGQNGLIGIWKDGAIIEKNLSYGNGVATEVKFTQDGNRIVINSHDNQTIKIIDINPSLLEKSIPAQLISVSNDSSKVLFYDGAKFVVWTGKENEPEILELKITEEVPGPFIGEVRDYRISNDGKYIAKLNTSINMEKGEVYKTINITNIKENKTIVIPVETLGIGFTFTPDSQNLIIVDDRIGLRIMDAENGNQKKSFKNILSNSYKLKISDDGKNIAINRLSGISEIYSLEDGTLTEKNPWRNTAS